MNSTLHNAVVGTAVAEATFGPFERNDLRRYAGASGDLNPLHLDSVFARQAGFDDVIVHGMLGMALLGRLVTEAYPAHRLLRFHARFRNVIAVGQPIACVARLEAIEIDAAVLRLTANNVQGAVLIDGTATVALSMST
jgi:acyl dehydratase